MNDKERVLKQAKQPLGPVEVKVEGLEDGYRLTFRANPERIRTDRRVAGSFIAFLSQVDRAGIRLPFFFRWLLRFWKRYNQK
ncbi:hypothetical protein ACOJUR_14660 [Alicyclobacillus tolerans]|uniref:Uncharacterized protein n=2 Tax=Alicyclobacillus tolerans TaxID=90970 RepID=A0A1M6WGB7_9BACL|nr:MULTISPECIES: hypothetical protein [Alicyclobacillus]MDP9728009.1 hypothetical protein [Alicyclobacillus tengchongensis]QRF24296.1 hypothetical protein FY534_12175 [Alicyclobacillus sp. TC]SHK92565.1 hypothetical protein SAMN05443507_12730 [Alicyclobacillus montanus]